MKKAAVVVAAGEGARYQSTTPKQFTTLNNKMIIEYTLSPFFPLVDRIVLVVAQEYLTLMKQFLKDIPSIIICEGGKSRQESVFLGLKALASFHPDYVAIHDGARPLVSSHLIENSFHIARLHNSAIPVIPVSDTLWERNSHTLLSTKANRDLFVCSQTPQTFHYHQIFEAHHNIAPDFDHFSDCAGVYVHSFEQVHTYKGDKNNIKLTSTQDLDFVKFALFTK